MRRFRWAIVAMLFAAGTASAAPLRLLSWNVRGIPLTHFEQRFPRIASVIAQQRPDFVALEELLTAGQFSQVRHALEPLGYAACCPTHGGRIRPGGLMLLWDTTKGWSVSDVAFVRYTRAGPWWRLNEGDRFGRKGFLIGNARNADGRAFRIVATHLQAQYPDHHHTYDDVRLAQVQQFTAAVEGSDAAIVAGDFNTTPADNVHRWLVTHGWRDATEGFRQRCAAAATLPCGTNIEDGKLTPDWYDYVLVRGALGDASVELIRNTHADEYSDHEGVLCTISP